MQDRNDESMEHFNSQVSKLTAEIQECQADCAQLRLELAGTKALVGELRSHVQQVTNLPKGGK